MLRDKVDQGKIRNRLTYHAEEFELYLKRSEEPSEGFKQGSDL